uniref:SH3 domain protein n=1 Tax=Candidatus Kentrum sp. TC TaxID=2126339 RepID=A0A450ZB29_9GAMM|nr:MAG: hypothetical protein BECKTC1821D_GA0114238_11281 [Candidatus Kentron sp. TC]VFK62549.1 MAG: hypothetical protein BECKTC1821F_GA0114240_10762 [Candidatus Kentron sp. TC]
MRCCAIMALRRTGDRDPIPGEWLHRIRISEHDADDHKANTVTENHVQSARAMLGRRFMKDAFENISTLFSLSDGRQWLIAGLLACLPWLAGAETFYVTDRVLIGVHKDKEQDRPPLEILPTGAALEVIFRDKDLAKVRTASDIVGWVDSNYLMMEKPAQLLLMELEAEHEQTKLRLQEVEARLRELGEETTVEKIPSEKTKISKNDIVSEFNVWLGLEFPLISTVPWKWGPLMLGFLLVFFLGGFSLNRAVCRRYYLVERGKRAGNKVPGKQGRKENQEGKTEKDKVSEFQGVA